MGNYDPLDTGFMPDPTMVTPGMGKKKAKSTPSPMKMSHAVKSTVDFSRHKMSEIKWSTGKEPKLSYPHVYRRLFERFSEVDSIAPGTEVIRRYMCVEEMQPFSDATSFGQR